MDLAGLRVVKAVADAGSVSRAAETLNCVQSNVTARLKRLEEDLGVPLFLRLSRGMAPTPAGRVLADYADRVLRPVAQARDAGAAAAGGGGGPARRAPGRDPPAWAPARPAPRPPGTHGVPP
ncbi:LysR family transcriptional regulator, partial [Azospirillum brasilense]|nr:LysR family transcriptional regulator [Azospirillum brasilense]